MRTLLLASALIALAGARAEAQPTERPLRLGLELGIGLQVGEIACESEGDFCDSFTEAGGGNLSAAYFVSPTLGVAVDLWAMSHREDDFTFSHYVSTIGVKWRPVPILTLTAGIGSAHAALDYDGFIDARVTSDNGFAVMAAAAVDLVRARSWALAVEARVGNGFYGDDNDNDTADVVGRNTGLGASFTYFGF